MFIKEILEYHHNYAEYIVSDGKYSVICICMSVPLPLNKEPEEGMKILIIDAFFENYDDVMLSNQKEYFIKKGKRPLAYILTGEIVDKDKGLVRVGDLLIDIGEGYKKTYNNGDYIEIKADRLDCYIDI